MLHEHVTDPIASRLRTAIRNARSARDELIERAANLRTEIDGARRVAALDTSPRPELHRAIRAARAELSALIAAS